MSLTDKAIEQIRELIRTGALPPGSKLPPEADLAVQLGLSRNLAREAVKALAVARVLEVRRGDGTYVTSLQPSLLLAGLGGAVELQQGDSAALRDLMEVRRLLEPMATSLAATRLSDEQLAEVERHLDAMREARDDVERLNAHDATLSQAAALLHVSHTEQWLREHLRSGEPPRVPTRREFVMCTPTPCDGLRLRRQSLNVPGDGSRDGPPGEE